MRCRRWTGSKHPLNVFKLLLLLLLLLLLTRSVRTLFLTFVQYFFQDKSGQEFCRECKHSGNEGAYGCNEEDGAFQCWGLFTPVSKCVELQVIIEGLLIAVVIFFLVVTVAIPLVFQS